MSVTQSRPGIGRTACAGLFLVALAIIAFEILLTRIFSVSMWYHFAFMAVSVAMFGMTVGALAVYLWPAYFSGEASPRRLAESSLGLALSMGVCFIAHLFVPLGIGGPARVFVSLALTYVVISVPFVFGGIAVSVALTKFPGHVGRLYAADLTGAALGCIVFVLLTQIMDAPSAVFVIAAVAAAGAAFFSRSAGSGRLFGLSLICAAGLLLVALSNALLAVEMRPFIRLLYAKGRREGVPLYEKWNSFSRIRVDGDTRAYHAPEAWGLSSTYPVNERPIRQLYLRIDATALTMINGYDGKASETEHLKYDLTSIAHYLRPDASVFVVGSGGGRDVLTALAFGQRAVTGVEINGAILRAANTLYGDFSGHLDRRPGVKFVNDEARSCLARTSDRYDILQISLIDTMAATAAGAFVLTENSLYTIEAWNLFLSRLTPRGVLTVSRWYFSDRPAEIYRLTALATAALAESGAGNPRNHILLARNIHRFQFGDTVEGIGTILVSREPFSDADIDIFEKLCRDFKFDLILTPRFAADPNLATLTSAGEFRQFAARYPLNITPPTDDSPFFFQMLRVRDLLGPRLAAHGQMVNFNLRAVYVLGSLLVIVTLLTLACVLFPLMSRARWPQMRGSAPFLLFFCAIGAGYMLIEISQMQRLTIFLGHPVYAVTVALFSLLLGSGLGSRFSERVSNAHGRRAQGACFAGLIVMLLLLGAVTPPMVRHFEGLTTSARIALAVGVMLPIGFFMGMPFPLGMTLAARRFPSLAPWFWGANGAMSVMASVCSVAIALSSGISAAYWTGVAGYIIAALSLMSVKKSFNGG